MDIMNSLKKSQKHLCEKTISTIIKTTLLKQ